MVIQLLWQIWIYTSFRLFNKKIDTTELMPSSQYEIAEYTPYQLDVHAYLMRKLMERPCCIQHTMDDFEVILEDLKLSGGKLLIARKQMEIVGMAFCILEESAIHIPELLYEDTEIRNSLLKEASRQMSTSFVEYIKPAKGESDQKLGMARIINVEQMLQLYAKEHNEIHLALEISDEIINENQGYYLLKYVFANGHLNQLKKHSTFYRRTNPNIVRLPYRSITRSAPFFYFTKTIYESDAKLIFFREDTFQLFGGQT